MFSRRDVLKKTGASLVAVGALAAPGLVRAADATKPVLASPKDGELLNSLLAAEFETIAAYQAGIDGGQMQQPGLNMALLFQSHHKAHRDALIAEIRKLNVQPAPAATTHNFETPKSQSDALDLTAKRESGTINAILVALPFFTDRALAKLAGRMLADDVMHWTSLMAVQQKPLPADPLTFGS